MLVGDIEILNTLRLIYLQNFNLKVKYPNFTRLGEILQKPFFLSDIIFHIHILN